MAIRLSGMVSGLDTDSVVQALMSAQKYKKTKIEASKQKLEWKQELWSDMNTKIYDFYRSALSKMRMQSTFKTKTAASSDSSKVTATAGSSATEGTYRIKVNSVASAQYVTSGALENVTTSTKLKDLGSGFDTDTQIQFTGKNEKAKASLLIDENTTVNDFLNAAKSVGINATYDTSLKRIFLGSTSSGDDQKFTIKAYKMDTEQAEAVQNWKEAIGYDRLSSADQSAVSKLFYQLQTEEMDDEGIQKVTDKLNTYLTKSEKAAVTAEITKQVTTNINQTYFKYEDSEDSSKKTGVTDAGKEAVKKSLQDAGKSETDIDAVLNDSEKLLKAAETLASNTIKKVMASDSAQGLISMAVSQGMGGFNSTDTKIEFDGKSYGISRGEEAFVNWSQTDRQGNLSAIVSDYYSIMNDENSPLTEASSVLNGLGLDNIDGTAVKEHKESDDDVTSAVGMVVVAASDASITFNGATLKSSNSTLTVNGLTLNILDKTDSEMTVTVSKDTSAVYDAVKDFISEYNSVLKAMNTSYNAASAKGYDVLTSEMKEEMTDDEIEKWESVVKSSLLRRDDTLSGLITSFRNDMMVSYTASDGKRYSLASLGIMTSSDYSEKGLLHIMGDEDDDVYADSENKLQNMLNKNPDLAMEILTGITGQFYGDLTKKMRSSKYSSALTFYNDKQMREQVTKYKKDITSWETKLSEMEERYYSQFTAMEKAMANLQSQQNSLTGFFG